ncbi:MAG: hypothetical protein M0010_05525, partial [Actinomycetota bacterium]|nr:hypothetical protein [Actinomycetota bacterium]
TWAASTSTPRPASSGCGGGADDDLDHLDNGALLAEWLRILMGRTGRWTRCSPTTSTSSAAPGQRGASLVETLFELEAGICCGQVSLTATKALVKTVCLSAATWIQNLAPEEWGGDPRTGPEERWWLARCESAQDFTGAPARFVQDHLGQPIRRLAAIGRFAPPLDDAYLGERDEENGTAEV